MNQINVLSKRYKFGEDFTLSRLSIDEEWLEHCRYILEDKVREIAGKPVSEWKIKCITAIPVGTYEVKKTWSGRWQKMMWEITGVEGFTGIRIHPGNTNHDTEGCLITGKERDEKHGEVSGSRLARDYLYARLDKAEAQGKKIFWTVEGLPEEI